MHCDLVPIGRPHDARAALVASVPVALRLLCNEMLQGSGRWLRAARYDTAIYGAGLPDRHLLDRARAEQRALLTCA